MNQFPISSELFCPQTVRTGKGVIGLNIFIRLPNSLKLITGCHCEHVLELLMAVTVKMMSPLCVYITITSSVRRHCFGLKIHISIAGIK